MFYRYIIQKQLNIGEATLQLTRQLAMCDLELFVRIEMAELPATLVKKTNAKSVMWVYFGLTDDEKGVPVPWWWAQASVQNV